MSNHLNEQRLPLVLVLDNVRSLHNVGAIFRTADAVHLEEIILGGLTPHPPRHEITKTALGATETVPWRAYLSTLDALRELRGRGYTLCALEQTGEAIPLSRTILTPPVALVVGHERMGVSQAALELCDTHLYLPMHGQSAHSLNVAVATGVALYQIAEQIRTS